VRFALAKRIGQEVDHQLHAVGIHAHNLVLLRLVGQWHGVVGLIGPLAQVHGVGSPVQQTGTGIEIPVTTPAAVHSRESQRFEDGESGMRSPTGLVPTAVHDS